MDHLRCITHTQFPSMNHPQTLTGTLFPVLLQHKSHPPTSIHSSSLPPGGQRPNKEEETRRGFLSVISVINSKISTLDRLCTLRIFMQNYIKTTDIEERELLHYDIHSLLSTLKYLCIANSRKETLSFAVISTIKARSECARAQINLSFTRCIFT